MTDRQASKRLTVRATPTVTATASSEYVWYRGKRIKYGELEALREDYNRPLVIQVAVSHRFSEAWSGTVSGRYRGGYDAIVETSRTVGVGIN